MAKFAKWGISIVSMRWVNKSENTCISVFLFRQDLYCNIELLLISWVLRWNATWSITERKNAITRNSCEAIIDMIALRNKVGIRFSQFSRHRNFPLNDSYLGSVAQTNRLSFFYRPCYFKSVWFFPLFLNFYKEFSLPLITKKKIVNHRTCMR